MPETLPQFKTLDSSPIKGPWVSLGHGQTPPSLPKAFGPPRFTQAEQAANPDKPMTRMVKDVLRVGKWKVETTEDGRPIFWTVAPKTLNNISDNFRLAQIRGVALNLGKTHGDPVTRLIHPDDLVAPIDRVVVEDDVLWLSVYVTPDQAKYLSNPAMKVSPGVYDDWFDGEGNLYPTQLVHVAVTDSPVVTGQGPFLALANRQSQQRKGIIMADEETTETESTDVEESPEQQDLAIDGPGVEALIEEISKLLPGDVGLPSDTTGDTLVRDLRLITGAVMENEPDEETPTEEVLIDTPGDLPAELSNRQVDPAIRQAFANQAKQLKALSNQVRTLSKAANTVPRTAFIQKMQRLGRAGVEAKFLSNRLAIADRHGDYDLAQLDGLVSGGVNLSNVAKTKRTADAPKVPGEKPKHTGIGRKAFGPRR